MKIDPDKMYTVKEVADWMACTEQTVYNYIKRRGLRHERLVHTRIKGAWLLAFRAKNTKGGEE